MVTQARKRQNPCITNSVDIYIGETLSALIQSALPLHKGSSWPHSTMAGEIGRPDVIGRKPDLRDLLERFRGKHVRVTVTELTEEEKS